MKALIRRLHQLERQLAPQPAAVSSLSLSLAAVIRERRRRRCEASGEPFEEMPSPRVPRHQENVYRSQRRCEWAGNCESLIDVRKHSQKRRDLATDNTT
jgi:hypothetical protein